GSGFSRKTRHLFDACAALGVSARYLPFDVSAETLMEAGARLTRDYEWLRVHALVGDYLAGLGHVSPPAGPGLVVFLGSTIGNFEHRQALGFLREVQALAGAQGWLLLGADRVKAPHVLHAAYNDARGYTARFNRNVLRVINRELGADFDPDAFHHYAPYDPARMQIDMYLVGARAQRIRFGALDRVLAMGEGEPIHTEVSRKFTREGLESLLGEAGFAVEQHHEPDDARYSLILARSDPVRRNAEIPSSGDDP
ncbi:MAG: L-histidine N(alpha)-methyltransferase, partial [Gammaproteobacteria bacterium]|nr:L-histidine N(alpha)-methyltransferase [Gammaproteobacteria bacterium]NIR84833.1 L-histidine N(alpha)-methyltransferase [Gammaproteobacteria bacterium]NIR91547.1 L-histidine N(alpha)-methyltransferase [Gammaproteobacteria bacterium]NIU05880.1 L-histidine N(alpha)-methyltransferase [Gammaproteobacteria bacterium]NIV76735.1 L-histidine N(alpha)-methyltransferase [Gammaproteobacteria bacterium]